MSKIIKSIFIPEEGIERVVKIPIPDVEELIECRSDDQNESVPQEDPQEQAAQILAKAQEEAAALLHQAQEEARMLREQATREGFEQGLLEGRRQAEAELASAMAEFKETCAMICDRLSQERSEVISTALEDLLKIILLFAEKIIRTTVSVDPSVLLNILAGAIEKVDGVTRALVRLHPEDLNILTRISEDTSVLASKYELEFVPDAQLPRYSCIVSTSKVTVEASVEAQIAELESCLRTALAKEAANRDT
ncbi:MAG: hypothetical protein GX058_01350 [Firmicutes bacterium]|nr:hypothetical protein [Bacillota bacterium]